MYTLGERERESVREKEKESQFSRRWKVIYSPVTTGREFPRKGWKALMTNIRRDWAIHTASRLIINLLGSFTEIADQERSSQLALHVSLCRSFIGLRWFYISYTQFRSIYQLIDCWIRLSSYLPISDYIYVYHLVAFDIYKYIYIYIYI